MKPFTKKKPGIEAKRVSIKADFISKSKKTKRSNVHHAGKIKAEGDVEITVRSQYPNTGNNPLRPPAGTVFESGRVIMEARKVEVSKESKSGRDTASASGFVGIFGKLKKR